MRIGGRNPPLAPDPDLIRTLAALLDETGLTEIEYAAGDQRIRIARVRGGVTAAAPAATDRAAGTPPLADPVAETPTLDPRNAVTAPMVGIAYLAADPGSPPFVQPGDTVSEGQTLLIIEAMKVMNQIRAPRAGRIARILVVDAQPVEYGTVLMAID